MTAGFVRGAGTGGIISVYNGGVTRYLRAWLLPALVATLVLGASPGHPLRGAVRVELVQDDEARLRLRASPRVAFAPASILFVGELRGGPDDNEELYCAAVEWDWGDDTISASIPDCDPFEPGVSRIRRRFSVRHTYDYGGRYEVRLHLKQRDETVISARTRIEVRGYRRR